MAKHDNFLAEEIHPSKAPVHLSYMDGFRLGIGITVGFLAVCLVLGGLSWALIIGLHLN
jgi:hypothetical protein